MLSIVYHNKKGGFQTSINSVKFNIFLNGYHIILNIIKKLQMWNRLLLILITILIIIIIIIIWYHKTQTTFRASFVTNNNRSVAIFYIIFSTISWEKPICSPHDYTAIAFLFFVNKHRLYFFSNILRWEASACHSLLFVYAHITVLHIINGFFTGNFKSKTPVSIPI